MLSILLTGSVLSLLLFGLTRAQAHACAQAERSAAGLRRSEQALRQLLDEQKRTEQFLAEEGRLNATLRRVAEVLAEELDHKRLLQRITDEAWKLSGAEFAAFFYNAADEQGGRYMLFTLSGAPREAFENFPMPHATAVFVPTFRGEGIVWLDDITQDPRYGPNPPSYGLPPGHLPVRSYLAVPVIARSRAVLGDLFLGHVQPGRFREIHERAVTGLAARRRSCSTTPSCTGTRRRRCGCATSSSPSPPMS